LVLKGLQQVKYLKDHSNSSVTMILYTEEYYYAGTVALLLQDCLTKSKVMRCLTSQ